MKADQELDAAIDAARTALKEPVKACDDGNGAQSRPPSIEPDLPDRGVDPFVANMDAAEKAQK